MYWWNLTRWARLLKWTHGTGQQSNTEKNAELLQLSEAIIAYGRMLQTHYSAQEAFVEVTELARRFRETPQTINDALLVLRETGRAEAGEIKGCWKLQCGAPVESSPEAVRRMG